MTQLRRPATPTLEDVARAAGVSRATVSRVVNGTRNVDPEIQAVVREALTRTGYVPNKAARSLATRSGVGSVALVLSGAGEEEQVFADPFFGRVVGGVLGHLGPRGSHPQLMLAEGHLARERVLAHLLGGGADGALVVSTHPADPLPDLLVGAGVPTVLFARPDGELPVSWVDMAQHEGGRLAAERLLGQGRRRLAVLSGPVDVHAARDRLTGFRETAARQGLSYVPTRAADFTLAGGEAAMRQLLADHPGLDGVFVANDLMAQGALHVLRDAGRRVPDDVAVVGFDDSSAALACRPLLTTVRQPVEAMAARMSELLLHALAAPGAEPTSTLFDPELIVRDSG